MFEIVVREYGPSEKTSAPFIQASGRGAVRGQVDCVHGFSRVDRVAELHPLPLGEEFEGDEGGVAADSRFLPRVDSLLVAVVLP